MIIRNSYTVAQPEARGKKRKKDPLNGTIGLPVKKAIVDHLSYEDFKRKHHFSRFLKKNRLHTIDRYVSKFMKEKNWASIDGSFSHLLRLQVHLERYFFALLFQACEERFEKKTGGKLSERMKRRRREDLLAKKRLIQAIDLLITSVKTSKRKALDLSSEDAEIFLKQLSRAKSYQSKVPNEPNVKHGDVMFRGELYGRDITNPATKLLVFVLSNIEYRFEYRKDDRKDRQRTLHTDEDSPPEYRAEIIPEDYTALADLLMFWELIKDGNDVTDVIDPNEKLRQRFKPYSLNVEIIFIDPDNDIPILLIPRKPIGCSIK